MEQLLIQGVAMGPESPVVELLAVVRGLEALDEPARITLITRSTYVREGLRYGLPEWRRNGWRWESFGAMIPVKNCDLWQRVDRAMGIHEIECRSWRIDPAHRPSVRPSGANFRRDRSSAGSSPAAQTRTRVEDRCDPAEDGCRQQALDTPCGRSGEPCARPQPWHRAVGLGKLAMMAMGRISCLATVAGRADFGGRQLKTA